MIALGLGPTLENFLGQFAQIFLRDSVVFNKTLVPEAVYTRIASVMFRTQSNDGCEVTSATKTSNVVNFAGRSWVSKVVA